MPPESRRAVVIGDTEGGPWPCCWRRPFPTAIPALVLVNTFARWRRAPDYAIGMPEATPTSCLDLYERHWGQDPAMLALTAPSVGDDRHMQEWFMRIQRFAMPPGAATHMYRWVLDLDVRSILPAISVPTLVLHRRENRHYRPEFGRSWPRASRVHSCANCRARTVSLFYTPPSGRCWKRSTEFVAGVQAGMPAERELATVLFTDVVGSTRIVAEIGDARWLEMRAAHDAIVRRNLQKFRGVEIERTGTVSLRRSTARHGPCTVPCASATRSGALGLEIRAGLHTGEIERRGAEIGGIAVHLASRILALAGAGEVLVSGTVTELVVGAGIGFEHRGDEILKGIPGTWRVCLVKSTS